MCDIQSSKKYTERNSPPYPANQCPGRWRVGNDGQMYLSVPNKNGIHRWVLRAPKPKTPAKPKPKTPAKPKPKTPAKLDYTTNYYGLYIKTSTGLPMKKAHDEIYRTIVNANGDSRVVNVVLLKYREEGANDTATRDIVNKQFKSLYKKRLDSQLVAVAGGSLVTQNDKVYADNAANRRLGRAGKPLGSHVVHK